ncbi:hypothetical protein SDC9_136227 [bioreactor metagenome]|uniref:Uncharacterized protein n=1 Tax=bioreactor metagenome TaxID=1076179 RepID=A0A645DIJ8_9ZZZZ
MKRVRSTDDSQVNFFFFNELRHIGVGGNFVLTGKVVCRLLGAAPDPGQAGIRQILYCRSMQVGHFPTSQNCDIVNRISHFDIELGNQDHFIYSGFLSVKPVKPFSTLRKRCHGRYHAANVDFAGSHQF